MITDIVVIFDNANNLKMINKSDQNIMEILLVITEPIKFLGKW